MELSRSKIRIYNEEHCIAVQKRLFELGYSWNGWKGIKNKNATSLYLGVEGDYSLSYMKDSHDNYFTHESTAKEITLTDLYKKPKEKSIQLTGDCKAIIKEGFIKVGCQEIPFEKIDELYKLIYS